MDKTRVKLTSNKAKLQKYALFLLALFFIVSCHNKNTVTPKPEAGKTVSTPKNYPVTADPDIFDIDVLSVEDPQVNYDAFISLSNVFNDSLLIPTDLIANQKQLPFKDLQYVELSTDARKKLLHHTKLSENDTLFVYNYELKKLTKTPISQLKAVAYLTPYVSEGEDLRADDYMIGFQIEAKKDFDDMSKRYDRSFGYFGKENPFISNGLSPIKWQKTNSNDFPTATENGNKQLTKGDTYKAQYLDHWVYIQDYLMEGQVQERLLLYTDKKKKVLFQMPILKEEGDEYNPLNGFDTDENSQWIGELLKNKPPVVLGFMSISFGCNNINYLQKDYPILQINCDNRH